MAMGVERNGGDVLPVSDRFIDVSEIVGHISRHMGGASLTLRMTRGVWLDGLGCKLGAKTRSFADAQDDTVRLIRLPHLMN